MLYLDSSHLDCLGSPWVDILLYLEDAVHCLRAGDVAQPLKPYLRYRNPVNRIIAMPAFVGGITNMAGLKWIASFPGNLDKGLARAHSVVVLNDVDTGIPICTINAGALSAIRTTAVSALIMRYFELERSIDGATVGIVGWGPIGRRHHQMIADLYGNRVARVLVYDLRSIQKACIPGHPATQVVNSWQEAYRLADVFITCTVSDRRYIDLPPKPGSLHLNVSLRDYMPATFEYLRSSIVVDDWEEVCRENTDIEAMHLQQGLVAADTRNIADIVCDQALASFLPEVPIMFNPMGMAIFDIAVATFYYRKAVTSGIGATLNVADMSPNTRNQM